jgi:Tfp pilus assembly protein PilX
MSTHRRGAIGIAVLGLLVLLEVVIVVAVVGGTLAQDLTLQRIDTNRAFYAAEGGVAMAVREAWLATDEDGDGAIGGISDDGDRADDPTVGGATVSVSPAQAGAVTTFVSIGWADRARRRVEMNLEQQ